MILLIIQTIDLTGKYVYEIKFISCATIEKIKDQSEASALAKHALENGHCYDFKNEQI